MIGRHVDVIAMALLLLLIAAFSSAKHVVLITLSGPVHFLRMDQPQKVRMPAMPETPSLPELPRVPLQRD